MPARLRLIIYLTVGTFTSFASAWLCAALRPSDGFPNVVKTPASDWRESYALPQHRIRTAWGDLFIDCTRTDLSTKVTQSPGWNKTIEPEMHWLYTTYPYPDDVPSDQAAMYPEWPKRHLPSWTPRLDGTEPEREIIATAWGWPRRCLFSIRRVGSRSTAATKGVLYEYCWVVPGTSPRLRELPFGIIPYGLAINTLCYAGCFAVGSSVMFRSLDVVRRALRRKRNRCPRCNYDRGGLSLDSPCPECGSTR